MPECRPQDLGEREDEMPVGDGADHLLPDELSPEGGSLGRTGGAKTTLLAGKGDEIFIPAGVAPDACEAALGKAAVQKRKPVNRYGERTEEPWRVEPHPFQTSIKLPYVPFSNEKGDSGSRRSPL